MIIICRFVATNVCAYWSARPAKVLSKQNAYHWHCVPQIFLNVLKRISYTSYNKDSVCGQTVLSLFWCVEPDPIRYKCFVRDFNPTRQPSDGSEGKNGNKVHARVHNLCDIKTLLNPISDADGRNHARQKAIQRMGSSETNSSIGSSDSAFNPVSEASSPAINLVPREASSSLLMLKHKNTRPYPCLLPWRS